MVHAGLAASWLEELAMTQPNVIWFENITIADVPVVGGKNASLGEMVRELGRDGVRVPLGYATSASAYRDFLAANGIEPVMRDRIRRYHAGESSLQETGAAIRQLILASRFPEAVIREILAAYDSLAERLGLAEPAVAVRSSATAEDLPSASFAGQQETFLNIRGHQALLDACLHCYASLFTDRAISYREAQGIDHLSVALSIGVQQMVRADLAGSGVIFTIDTETGFPRVAIVSAAWGLGETVVQGAVEPDRYLLFKPLLQKDGIRPIIGKACAAKAVRMIYAGDEAGADDAQRTRIVATTPEDQARFVLSDDEVLELGRWALSVERHYGRAMDIEWAKDGETGLLYLVQARPETVQSARKASTFANYRLNARAKPILTGAAVGSAIGAGKGCVIREAADIGRFPPGAVLVTGNTDPDWVPVMKLAAGIVTDHGGSTSHAAIVSRELGVPAVIGTGNATALLRDGQDITLSCASGEVGHVYDGRLDFSCEEIDLGAIPETRTEVMVNIAEPASASRWWQLPAKGVGLARMEFIINNLIKVHPMALLHPERVSAEDNRRIAELVRGHASPADYFVEELARGIARLAAPYHPHPAIVRLSDFKTNEYAHLLGGH